MFPSVGPYGTVAVGGYMQPNERLIAKKEAWAEAKRGLTEVGRGPLRITTRPLLGIEFNQAFADGEDGSLRPVVHLQFVENVSHMVLYGLFTKVKVIGDFLVGFTV